jgi:hypothetical protein
MIGESSFAFFILHFTFYNLQEAMMQRITKFLIAICCCTAPLNALQAQNLEDYVSKYTSENGKAYMQPLADAFGANLNSGFYHSARISTLGLHFYIGIETMIAPIAEDTKTFTAKTEEPFSPAQTAEAPTIFGSGKGAAVTGTGGTVFNFPGGLDIKKLPLAVPQVSVGSILGTEATLRFIQSETNENIGKVKLFGFGAQHSISQYFKDFPVDLAVGFLIQKFEVGNIVEANAKYFGVQGSYSRSLLTLYGGIGVESANLDISYNYESDAGNEKIAFNLDADNSVRFTAGVALNLAVLKLHADYNLSSQNVIALGLGFGF